MNKCWFALPERAGGADAAVASTAEVDVEVDAVFSLGIITSQHMVVLRDFLRNTASNLGTSHPHVGLSVNGR
jgi:hypothetical protein